ncbi:MAG: AAA family ATPase [Caldimonas sp.]
MSETQAPLIRFVWLGAPSVHCGAVEVRLSVKKTLALLVYLSIAGRSSRRRLADLFWSDLDEATGRRNLRRALHRLRAAGLGDAMDVGEDAIALRASESDLDAFRRAAAEGRLSDACATSDAPLCDGFSLDAEAPAFDAWLLAERERAGRERRDALARHAARREAAGDLREALSLQWRLLAGDPLQEATYRDLMRLHDALGERGAALEAYAAGEALLRAELGLEPLAETRLLAERIRSGGDAGLPAPGPATHRPVVRVDLGSAPLVAREREIAAIVSAAAPLVLIVGDAGVGKTRLAREAALRRGAGDVSSTAVAPGDEVVVVRFSEMSSSTPFYAVANALRGSAMNAALAALDPLWRHELARLLPELDAGGTAIEAIRSATPVEPADEARLRLLEAVWQAFASSGTAIVFDDVHWADASSVELIGHVARRSAAAASGAPRLLATARSVELADHAANSLAFAAMAAEGLLERHALGAFDDWSMLQLVHGLSRSGGGARFAARLNAATGGNVFFALETIRALLEAGELVVGADAGWSTRYDDTTTDYAELPLPASVVDAVRARVARLGGSAARLLETAALAEDGATLAEIQGATALADWEALDGIERAIAARFVDRSGPGYRFAHELFRTAIRSGLSPERRRLTHARLATTLEPLHAAPARIASHWQAAGEAARAAAAWQRAGEAATALFAHREAATHFERAAELTADSEPAFALYDRAIQRLFHIRAAFHEADALLGRLLDRVDREGSASSRFLVLKSTAEAASHLRRHADAARYVRMALASGPAPSNLHHHHALVILAFSEGMLGHLDAALAGYRTALDYARLQGIERGVGMTAASAAGVALQLDRLDEAAELRDLALAVAERVMPGELRQANVLSKTSFLSRAMGDRASALQQLGRAVEIGFATKSSMFVGLFLANQCETLVDDGRPVEAEACHARLATLAEPMDDEMRYLLALTRAVVDESLGDIGAAIAQARSSIAAADRIGNEPDQREARFLAARMIAAVGATDAALALAEEAARIVPADWQPIFLPLAVLRAGARLDDAPEEARTIISAALDAPFDDRLLHAKIDAARVVLGRCELALGRAEAARAAVRDVGYSVGLEADAWCVRVAAARLDGRCPDDVATATAWLDKGRAPPLERLALMVALAPTRPKRGAAAWRSRAAAAAQAIADSLRTEPPLQSAFIRKYRDLLT